jgi:hypothetical protein
LPAETFLGRIARHGVGFAVDPHEDRLTEVCAAVFESDHCAGLARHVALGWLAAALNDARMPTKEPLGKIRDLLADDATAWACAVRTQLELKTSEGRRRPDLELSFTTEDELRQNVTVWVEVKHGTKPHSRQLQAYLENLRRLRGGHSVLLLLAPRAKLPSFDPDEIPEEVPQLTWEATASSIESFDTAEPVGRFLRDELFAYLKEEKLSGSGTANTCVPEVVPHLLRCQAVPGRRLRTRRRGGEPTLG